MARRGLLVSVSTAGLALAGVWLYSCGGDDSAQPGPTVGPDGAPYDQTLPPSDSPAQESRAPDSPASDSPAPGEASVDGAMAPSSSVLMHHKNPSRDGLYVDPAFTATAAAAIKRDPAFKATTQGQTQAQPLYVENLTAGKDAIFIATEQNNVYAFDAATGAALWKQTLATPLALADLPCGPPTDPHGIMATPIIDMPSRTLFLEAFTTPDNGQTKQHKIYALSIDDGSTKAGWPVDVSKAVAGFDSTTQNGRGALAIAAGWVYVPYAGLNGDCGSYHGWVIGVPLNTPGGAAGWATTAAAGGIWGGIASDGTNVYAATGNTMGANGQWGGGEAVIRLNNGVTFSKASADYFAPANWQALDDGDADLGSSGPILVDVPGATPSKLVAAMGKDGHFYLADRTSLGGIGGEVANVQVMNGAIKTAAVTYTASKGTYVVLRGEGSGASCPGGTSGTLVALSISATAPPKVSTAWCADPHGLGNPIVTTTDGHASPIVWVVGAEGDNKLYGYDGQTGAPVFTGGGPNEQMGTVRDWTTLIEAKHRLFVAGDGQVYAFTTP